MLARQDAVQDAIEQFLSQPFAFSHPGNRVTETGDIEILAGGAPERLNGEIAGLIGGIRISPIPLAAAPWTG